jgi:hypothetical protein
MTVLDDAMLIVRGIARAAHCQEIPEVRIIFASPADQVRFKLELVKSFDPADVVSAPIASRGGADCLEIAGLQVELGNKLRGSRALLESIIKAAEVALEDGRRRTIAPAEILAMRQSLSDLLQIVKG